MKTPNDTETTFITTNVDSSGAALVFELTVTDYSGAFSTDTCIVNVTWVNTPPVADAGLDQDVAEGDEVFLDGSTSTDADDQSITSYRWAQTTGSPVELSATTTPDPMFIVPNGAADGGPLTFQLTVTDSGGLQGVDHCQVNIQAVAPSLIVSDIRVDLKQKGKTVEANAYVSVMDNSGMAVKNAAFIGRWIYKGNPLNTVTVATKGEGVARLYMGQSGAKSGSVFTIEILGVVKEGYTYESTLNQLQQDSLVVP